jgi:beta-aspartyl-peptidase (threonine type)
MRLSPLLLATLVTACASAPDPAEAPAWALAIHGGAGTILRERTTVEQEAAYRGALEAALRTGTEILSAGGSAMDAVEAVVRRLEDDPRFNAGRGAVRTRAGTFELDACIMDGSTLRSGAVTGIRRVRHPVALARAVMERTRHVFMAGDGAEAIAREAGLELVENAWFGSEGLPPRAPSDQGRDDPRDRDRYGTVGAVARDSAGRLAAATSTGGLGGKLSGRIGDAPIVGAGTLADATCAVSCTGTGELFIRHGIAREMSALIRYRGLPLEDAAKTLIHERLEPGDGGLIAVDAQGRIASAHNTDGMYRGFADSRGRFEVAIWDR